MTTSLVTGNRPLAEVLSPAAIRALSAAFGGERIYVPSPEGLICDTRERLEALLGDEAQNLFAEYPTQVIAVPTLWPSLQEKRGKLKSRASKDLQGLGYSIREIAVVFGLAERTVKDLLSASPAVEG
jgi:hypothetical protein